jgi:HPt (histidine-containing phosphotransfer) domain-containing protein
MPLSTTTGLSLAAGNRAVLSVSDGLERVMGDRALYRQLLQRFRDDYRPLGRQLRQAQADNMLSTLQRRIHTVKGAAGMIGAPTVCQLATALEPACHLPAAACAETVMLLDDALRALLDAIDGLLGDVPAPAPVLAPTAPADNQLLARLAGLLDTGDGAAIDLLEQSASPLAARLGVARYQQVAAAAHQFDFEAALAALAPLP